MYQACWRYYGFFFKKKKNSYYVSPVSRHWSLISVITKWFWDCMSGSSHSETSFHYEGESVTVETTQIYWKISLLIPLEGWRSGAGCSSSSSSTLKMFGVEWEEMSLTISFQRRSLICSYLADFDGEFKSRGLLFFLLLHFSSLWLTVGVKIK